MKTLTPTFNLPGEVKDIVIPAFAHNKIFSAADMWNIDRRKRTWVKRRFTN